MPDRVATATARTIEKFMVEGGGKLDVDCVFSGIRESPDQSLSRWQARVWLARELSVSAICPVEAIVDMLSSAILDRYDEALIGNIVHLWAMRGEWSAATGAGQLQGRTRTPIT